MAELIKTQFGFQSTAVDVIAGVDLRGKRAVVTGGSAGIGVETARALAKAGAEVTLTARNVEAGERVVADIQRTTGNDEVFVRSLDLSDAGSIDAFVRSWRGPLDILVNNAGMMGFPELRRSPRGFELQIATNHLGHFRLALALHGALKAAEGARIVSLSSRGHLRSPVVFDDIHFVSRPYDALLAYGQSKTANVLFAVEASRRWVADGITANAVHPGTIKATDLSRYMDPKLMAALVAAPFFKDKSIAQGAATSVLVATSPRVRGIGGRYFEDCNEAEVVHPEPGGGFMPGGVAAYAVDPINAARLWEVSLEMLGR